jgi:acyl-CoA dehydrogenase
MPRRSHEAYHQGARRKASNDLQAATMWLMQNAMQKPDNAGAGSYRLHAPLRAGALGYMWAQMAKAARFL